ncbi:MAG: serine O-acetyltransferase EpsC [Bacteroidota bacterium]
MPTSFDHLTDDADLRRWADHVSAARREYGLPLDFGECAEAFVRSVLALLFPHFTASRPSGQQSVSEEIDHLLGCLLRGLRPLVPERAEAVAAETLAVLPELTAMLGDDAQALYAGDPAAESQDEVILAYPGFFAVAVYRVAHVLYRADVPILPRVLTEFAHRETGIDIHPGARIGRAFAIDHGTGVVIGETTVIGERVRLFQGVTLGALAVAKDLARTKRHPTIEDDVVIYANATILGGETVIGARSAIGGNVWLTRSVPPDSIVTHRSDIRLRSEADDLIEYHI